MFIGAMIYNILLFVIISIITIVLAINKNTSYEIFLSIIKSGICIFLGFISTILSIHSMKITIDKAISSNDEKFAKWHTIKIGIFRKFIILIILAIILNFLSVKYVLTFSLSLLGIKVSAYIVPLIENKIDETTN